MRFASSMIEITDSPDTKQWCEFVLNHPHGNIFQTLEMAEVYRRTKNYAPVALAAFDTKNDLPFIINNKCYLNIKMDYLIGGEEWY